MAVHNELGKEGERLASQYLCEKGYQLINKNWRYGQWEIDLIAAKASLLVFVEVKTRSQNKFGYPEEAVSERKKAWLQAAAEAYLEEFPFEGELRFDIIAITASKKEGINIHHIEDAF